MNDVIEKIKQNAFGIREQVGEGEETRWTEVVRLKYVLKILEDHEEQETQKLQELADTLEKRPKFKISKDLKYPLSDLERIEKYFRVIEKKFAEFGLDTKKETTK